MSPYTVNTSSPRHNYSKKETNNSSTDPKSPKKIPIPLLILIPILLGVFIYASINIINWISANAKNAEIQSDLNTSITHSSSNNYEIDFEKLRARNPETTAYLTVPGTNINYVVVQGGNNDYYLTHNFDHEYNISGWPFGDYRNESPLSTKNQNYIIYGHSTKDGSMFGSLPDTLSLSWQENFATSPITLVTPEGTINYQVFSTYTTDPEDYYLTTNLPTSEEYKSFLNALKSRSNHDYHQDLTNVTSILTLSTCNLDGSKRIVLHAHKLQ
ncbi:class B sortase [Candidatus Saccharibacteria bacterium]|nr:class B sortase [Candidatus Saccharibacteria bacterium]